MTKRLLIPLVLSVAALLSYWFVQSLEEDLTATREISTQGPDYYMREVLSTEMNEDGVPKHQLFTRHLVHFPEDDRTELTAPRLTIHQQDGTVWTVQADKGTIEQNTEEIFLQGDVIINRPPISEQDTSQAVQIITQDLWVDPNDKTARTDEPVRLTRKDVTVNATGLRADLDNETMELMANVRGTYVPIQ
jgi:lipopolysaccharide export system protein LptC